MPSRRDSRVACAGGGRQGSQSGALRARGVRLLRILVVCNAILALFLAIRLAETGTTAAAAASASHLRAQDLRVISLPPNAERPAGAVPREFLLHLGAEFVVPNAAPSPVDVGLVAEPPLDLTTVWQAGSQLRVLVRGAAAPATDYRLQFTREMTSLDGTILPAGTAIVWATPDAAIAEVVVEDDPKSLPGRGATTLRVAVDQALDAAVAKQYLRLVDPATGSALPSRVEPLPEGRGAMFRISLERGELPPMVQVQLEKGVVPLRGRRPAQRTVSRVVDVYQPLELTATEASSQEVLLRFNRAVAHPELALVDVVPKPAGELRWEPRSEGLAVLGSFAPGSLVTVRLAAGFPGHGRSVLAAPVRRSVLVPDLAPRLDLLGDGEVLSARAEPKLTIVGCNVSKAWLRLRRVYDNNVVRMLQDDDLRVYAPAVEKELSVVATRNVEWREPVDLHELLGADPRGCYQVELMHGNDYWPERRLLQITDLGVTVRAGGDGAAVQVVSLADGTPRSGALVTLVSPTNQILAEAHTDGDGLARLRWQGGAAERAPFLVTVVDGEDRVHVGMSQFAVQLADEGLGGRGYVREGVEALLWTSRGIVRPGERPELTALVRDAAGAAAVDRDLQVVVAGPGGKEFRRLRATTPGSGLVAVALELPTDAPCGRWSASVVTRRENVVVGRASFEVAAFVPNRLEATAGIAPGATLGGTMTVQVHGAWLDGTPAAGRPVVARVRLLHGEFRPAEWAAFSFASGDDSPPPGELEAVEGALDEHGDAELRFALPPAPRNQALQAVVFAEVLDPSGRPVRAQAQQVVCQPEYVLGIAADRGGIRLRAIDAEGHSLAAGDVQVRVERRRWSWSYEARDDHRWQWRNHLEADVLQERTVGLGAEGATCELPELRGEGWFVAVVSGAGRRAEQVVGEVTRPPDRLRVRAANRPAPGEMAWLDIESPAAARGFVTLESDTLHGASVVALVAGHNRIAVPVPSGLKLPNLHAVVTTTRGLRAAAPGAGPAWLVGACDLPLERGDLATKVEIQAPEQVLPQQELSISVAAPGATAAVVAVVDEGVLGITGHASPDPLAFFLASRQLQTHGADTGTKLVRDMVFAPGAKTGGDDDDLASLLRGGSVDPHIRPLALFAELRLADGRGSTVLHLPPYEGRVRVMVLAAGPNRCGGAARAVVVKAPLGLQAAAPRMVAPGDRFVVPVSVRNDVGVPGPVALEIQVPAGLEAQGPARLDVPAGPGRVSTVDVSLRARPGCEGTQSVMVIARCGQETRSVVVDVVVREVRLPVAEFVGLRLGEAAEVHVPADWSPSPLRARMSLDVAPDRQLRPALEAMLQYPYGCCEQTTSRGMALANCAALLPRLYDDPAEVPAVLPLVQAAVDRLFGMQTTRGGFGWWLGSRDDDAFLTVHVLDFLQQARELGAEVPGAAMERALARLEAFAADAGSLDLRCHAIEVLARHGRPVQPRLDWLCTQSVGAEARARLATALALLGDRRRAAELLLQGDESPEVEVAPLSSALRADALRVRALLAIDPADPTLPGLVASLQRRLLRPATLTTQEIAQALRAVADHYRRLPAPADVPPIHVSVDGADVLVARGKPVALSVHPGSAIRVPAGAAGFGLLELRGFAPPVPANEPRLVLERTIVDLQTGEPTPFLRRGHVYEVRITAEAGVPLRDVVVVDVLPGGCEPEPVPAGEPHGAAGGAEDSDEEPAVRRGTNARAKPGPVVAAASVEARDDRVLMFCTKLPAGRFELRHRIRAVFPGEYEVPQVRAMAMYDPSLVAAEPAARRIEVVQ